MQGESRRHLRLGQCAEAWSALSFKALRHRRVVDILRVPHLRTVLNRVTMADSTTSTAPDPTEVRGSRRSRMIFKRVFQLSSLFFLIKGLAWLALAWWTL